MRQQCVFLSLLSYCFISEKDLGKREKLTITEPKGIVRGMGSKMLAVMGQVLMQAMVFSVKSETKGDCALGKGGFKIVFVENTVT